MTNYISKIIPALISRCLLIQFESFDLSILQLQDDLQINMYHLFNKNYFIIQNIYRLFHKKDIDINMIYMLKFGVTVDEFKNIRSCSTHIPFEYIFNIISYQFMQKKDIKAISKLHQIYNILQHIQFPYQFNSIISKY